MKLMRAKVMLFRNGNIAVFDSDGQQIPEAQKNGWIGLVAKQLESAGIDPTNCEWSMPDGSTIEIIKTEDGYNWRFAPVFTRAL